MGLLFGMVLPCGLGLGLGCAALDFALGLALATAFLGPGLALGSIGPALGTDEGSFGNALDLALPLKGVICLTTGAATSFCVSPSSAIAKASGISAVGGPHRI